MKPTSLQKIGPASLNAIPKGIALAVAVTLIQQDAHAAVLVVNLGVASNFGVLAGSGITVAGAINSTSITGDIGSHPTPSITGLENVILDGVNHAGDAVTQQAKIDLAIAYADAAGRTPTTTYSPIFELGGSTLGSGVYKNPSSFSITTNLTLDAGGDPDAVWIFQMGSTLTTGPGSNVILTGGAKASNIFWQVGSSATLGTGSTLAGSILAQESITLTTGADLSGRALALTGAVTMDNNIVVVPEAGSTLLFGAGLLTLISRRRRSSEGEQPESKTSR